MCLVKNTTFISITVVVDDDDVDVDDVVVDDDDDDDVDDDDVVDYDVLVLCSFSRFCLRSRAKFFSS